MYRHDGFECIGDLLGESFDIFWGSVTYRSAFRSLHHSGQQVLLYQVHNLTTTLKIRSDISLVTYLFDIVASFKLNLLYRANDWLLIIFSLRQYHR
jgi:hypothetical protein